MRSRVSGSESGASGRSTVVEVGAAVGAGGQSAEGGLIGAVVAPVGDEEHHRRARPGSEQLLDEGAAPLVPPLRVVDPEDERLPGAKRGEELFQRARGPAERVGRRTLSPWWPSGRRMASTRSRTGKPGRGRLSCGGSNDRHLVRR